MLSRYVRYIAILLLPIFLAGSVGIAKPIKPRTDKDLFKVTVRILNKDESGGGTGSILESSKRGSVILTNDHVCEVVEKGGVVDPPSHQKTPIRAIKRDSEHDLCLVLVSADLGVDLSIASASPEGGDSAVIAGHPSLMPTIITRGHFSESIMIKVQYGSRECTEEDRQDPKNAFYCMICGRLPLVKEREALVISATIMPGSSGSPVFNDRGEIAAVVFAGRGELGYALAVPLSYIWDFMDRSSVMKWSRVSLN